MPYLDPRVSVYRVKDPLTYDVLACPKKPLVADPQELGHSLPAQKPNPASNLTRPSNDMSIALYKVTCSIRNSYPIYISAITIFLHFIAPLFFLFFLFPTPKTIQVGGGTNPSRVATCYD